MKPTIFCSACMLLAASLTDAAHATSATVCDAFARDYAQRVSRQGQVLGGAARGSLLGLGVGAISGVDRGTATAIGGGAGAIAGGARRNRDFDRIYNAAFRDCMAGRIR